MKIVIDIPEILYTKIQNGKADKRTLETVILHGTPLPEGHGRLIDADELELDTEWDFEENEFISVSQKQIDHADTIVSAEAESEE